MQSMLNIAIQAATQAAKVINLNLDRIDLVKVTKKSHNDFVTEVDKKSESIIIEHIEKYFPDHQIIAEESGIREKKSDFTWIIDPLDGTNNFIHGYPHVSISIALQQKSELKMALVYNSTTHEIFSAIQGKGAKLNNTRIRISQPKNLSRALIGTGSPFRANQPVEPYLNVFKEVIEHCSDIRRSGSAALDLAYVAAGKLDGFWESGLKIWDIAAGVLLVKEAGGIVSDFNNHDAMLSNGEIVAGGKLTHKNLLRILSKHQNITANEI